VILVGFIDWLLGREDETPNQRQRSEHPVQKIEKEVLETIIESAKAAHPNEFAGALRAEGDTITAVLLVPGTVQGARHAVIRMNRLPVDRSVVGVVHSHPSKSARPSKEDLQLFGKHGHTHIIIHHPYTETTWRTWNHRGEPVHLDVV
jgi:proteasome lid subunit RPN8/RPN11